MEAQRSPDNHRNLEKEQSWEYRVTQHQTIPQDYTNRNSVVLSKKQTRKAIEQNREPRYNTPPTALGSINI